jgi:hypothetical protein
MSSRTAYKLNQRGRTPCGSCWMQSWTLPVKSKPNGHFMYGSVEEDKTLRGSYWDDKFAKDSTDQHIAMHNNTV